MIRSFSFFLALVFGLSFVPVNLVFAHVSDADHKHGRADEIKAKSCDKLQTVSSRLSDHFKEKRSEAYNKRADKLELSKDKRQQREQELEAKRQEWDEKRQKSYEILRSKATNDNQKAAVEEYIEVIDTAIEQRRASFDSAREEFKLGLDATISSKRSGSEQASSQLKSQIDSAIAKAVSSCESGTSIKDVLATLRSDIKSAQQNFKNTTKTGSVKESIQALNADRKKAFEEAISTFRESTEKARKDLLSAFGEQAQTIEN